MVLPSPVPLGLQARPQLRGILAVMFGSGLIIGPDPSQLKLPSCSVVKNLCASAGDTGDPGSIPGSGRFPGEGNDNPLQYSCLENSIGQRSLVGYSSWSHKELDATE